MGLTLHTPTITSNRWCGPAAISAITGMDSGTAAQMIRQTFNRRSVKGTHNFEVRRILYLLGYNTKPLYRAPRGKGLTLAAWLKQTKNDRQAGRIFLVAAGWHWQVISGRRYTCGIVKEIVSIRDKRVKRRARVSDVFEVTK